MTYVRYRGTPDLFITFTCNPSWPEITVELLPGQVAADRVDLVVRTEIRPDQADSIISAEIPDKEEDPISYEVVTKNMSHGPFCNRNRKAPCIVNGKCSKRFPKQMLQEEQTGDDGYPLCHRRKPGDGVHVTPGRAPESGMLEDVDNSWVLPYSPLFCRIFKVLQLSQKHQVHLQVC
ncbi:ATP-dependent DNA helicase [Trichonephila clavipes]|nr:ATP-dependent DNA helicase [Trichonephila clavipes]